MDLRPYIKSKKQLEDGIKLISEKLLFYQPFILADQIEVGEGQNFCDDYKDADSVFDMNVYAPNVNIGERKQPQDLAYFRKCNSEYGELYKYVSDQIASQFNNNVSGMTFAEIGCNTGLNLFNMALRGAKECYGYDWTDMSPVFSWLNSVLNTKVKFRQAAYDNLQHKLKGIDAPEVDVMINTVFTNHLCDPLQFLCYICDRARKGVFLWTLISPDKESCTILYPDEPPHQILDAGRPFPLNFYNGISMSKKLVLQSFRCLGFEDITDIPEFTPAMHWKNSIQKGFHMFFAKRTKNIKSAYWYANQASKGKISPEDKNSLQNSLKTFSFFGSKRKAS